MSEQSASGTERPLIYQIFADKGVESEVLSGYGRVVRVGLDAEDTNVSEPVRADARNCPLASGADLAVLHPPCTRWAEMTSISGDRDDHPDLISEARELGRDLADHYIIENVPRAPLQDPVVLDGKMFGLPIKVERAFETSFSVEQPPRHASLTPDTETSPYFYSDRSREWWAATKGYPDRYPKQHMAKNTIPAPYIRYLLREWMTEARGAVGGADYSSHDELDVEARREKNRSLDGYATDGGCSIDAETEQDGGLDV